MKITTYKRLAIYIVIAVLVFACCQGNESGKTPNDSGLTVSTDTVYPIGSDGRPIRPFEEKDTVIYGPSGDESWIPLNKLPIKDYSFERILREFGKENLIYKESGDYYDVYNFIRNFDDYAPKVIYDI